MTKMVISAVTALLLVLSFCIVCVSSSVEQACTVDSSGLSTCLAKGAAMMQMGAVDGRGATTELVERGEEVDEDDAGLLLLEEVGEQDEEGSRRRRRRRRRGSRRRRKSGKKSKASSKKSSSQEPSATATIDMKTSQYFACKRKKEGRSCKLFGKSGVCVTSLARHPAKARKRKLRVLMCELNGKRPLPVTDPGPQLEKHPLPRPEIRPLPKPETRPLVKHENLPMPRPLIRPLPATRPPVNKSIAARDSVDTMDQANGALKATINNPSRGGPIELTLDIREQRSVVNNPGDGGIVERTLDIRNGAGVIPAKPVVAERTLDLRKTHDPEPAKPALTDVLEFTITAAETAQPALPDVGRNLPPSLHDQPSLTKTPPASAHPAGPGLADVLERMIVAKKK